MKYESTPNCGRGTHIVFKYEDWLADECIGGVPVNIVQDNAEKVVQDDSVGSDKKVRIGDMGKDVGIGLA
jgi:hypothetical protein